MDDTQAIADAVVARLRPLLEARALKPRLLNVKQVSLYLGRSETAIRQLAAKGPGDGGLPCVRADGRVMFDVQDLDIWIESNKR